MSDELNLEKLREEVNPVFSTAQACMLQLAKHGDADFIKLRDALGLDEGSADFKSGGGDSLPPETREAFSLALPVLSAMVEGRFYASNNYIIASGAKQVLDLPSGYTARGIKLSNSGIKYFGVDLPAVIDVMKPAVEKIIGENENISYCAVDATNYASLRKALESADGELFITTEGLLMYFTQSELETVFGNIRKLLLEFGGKWVTMDNDLDDSQAKTLKVVLADMPAEKCDQIARVAAGIVSKTTLANNSFFDKDKEKIKKFVSDMGFDLEIVPIRQYMPEQLAAFSKFPEDIRIKATEALSSCNFWVMTPKSSTFDKFECNEDNFKADVKLSDDTLVVTLTGRLDTISSPNLLALYKDAAAKGNITSICIDMKNLEYVSSAGLRVLLIMRKALGDSSDFGLINISDTVRDIIEMTGFDSIFC